MHGEVWLGASARRADRWPGRWNGVGGDAGPQAYRLQHAGHVHAGLERQALGDVVVARGVVAAQGAGHPALAAVVGGQHERPIAETSVELPQVAGGGAGIRLRVETLIGIDRGQAERACRGRHQLVEPCRAGRTAGFRIESRFDFGYPDQATGQAFRLEDGLEAGNLLGRPLRQGTRGDPPPPGGTGRGRADPLLLDGRGGEGDPRWLARRSRRREDGTGGADRDRPLGGGGRQIERGRCRACGRLRNRLWNLLDGGLGGLVVVHAGRQPSAVGGQSLVLAGPGGQLPGFAGIGGDLFDRAGAETGGDIAQPGTDARQNPRVFVAVEHPLRGPVGRVGGPGLETCPFDGDRRIAGWGRAAGGEQHRGSGQSPATGPATVHRAAGRVRISLSIDGQASSA